MAHPRQPGIANLSQKVSEHTRKRHKLGVGWPSRLLPRCCRVKEEDRQNEELLNLSNEILELTKAIHSYAKARPEGAPPAKS